MPDSLSLVFKHGLPERPLLLGILLGYHLNNRIFLGHHRFDLGARQSPRLLSFCKWPQNRRLLQKLANDK